MKEQLNRHKLCSPFANIFTLKAIYLVYYKNGEKNEDGSNKGHY